MTAPQNVTTTTANAPPPPAAVQQPDTQPTFTQADVDRIAGERAGRERAKFADYPELKAAADKLAVIEAANATDLEKAVNAARAEGRTEVLTAANGRLLNAEARALAAEAKARNPLVAVRSMDLTNVKVAEDGTVDSAAIKTLLADLQKTDPYLFGDPPPVPPPGAGQAGIGVTGGATQPTNPRAADLAQIEADMKAGARRN